MIIYKERFILETTRELFMDLYERTQDKFYLRLVQDINHKLLKG